MSQKCAAVTHFCATYGAPGFTMYFNQLACIRMTRPCDGSGVRQPIGALADKKIPSPAKGLQAKIQRGQPCLHRNPAIGALGWQQISLGHWKNKMRHKCPISAPRDASFPSNCDNVTAS
jgi:hypothetical protein